MQSGQRRRLAGKRAPKLSTEDRRSHLLGCAIKIFARKGLSSGGHSDVAAEAQVAVPTIFNYFPSRELLLKAVVNEVERVILGRAAIAAAAEETVPGKFHAILRDFYDFLKIDPAYARIWFNWSTSFIDDVWPLYERFIQSTISFHRTLINDGLARGEPLEHVDPEICAYQIMGAATVIVQMSQRTVSHEQVVVYLEAAMHGALNQT